MQKPRRGRHVLVAIGVTLMLIGAGCGDGDTAPETTAVAEAAAPSPTTPPTPTEVPTEVPTATAEQTATAEPAADTDEVRLAAAENFRATFYSYDADALGAIVADSPSADFVLFYQGWAQGANYGVLDLIPCEATPDDRFVCSTTVEDDLLKTLGILDFNVTDNFTIAVDDAGGIREIVLTSDDPPEVGAAFGWVFANRPELFDGDCEGFFEGGPTPTACAVSFVGALADYAAEQG